MKQLAFGKQLNIRYGSKRGLNSIIKIFILLVFISLLMFFYTTVSGSTKEEERAMCDAETDVVLIMDRSGSMEEGGSDSLCVWYVREETASSSQFKKKTAEGESEEWCNNKIDKSIPDQYEQYYEESRDNKMIAAKDAAKGFVDLLESGDQSSLVYFSYYSDGLWTAKLEKTLSSNHQSTKNSIEALTTNGSTNIGDAIDLANQELVSSRANPQATKAAILLTDGMANRPFGPGHGEYDEDLKYALKKAEQSASQGFKIFTIGLGSNDDINETMLQKIATTTDAEYYHSPTQEELVSIYEEISQELCDYGSISGCKFNDINRNGEWDEGEEYLPEWEIMLTNNKATTTQITDEQGCYKFSGLAGEYDYILQETISDNWTQTYPETGKYQVSLAWEEHVSGYDFGNYYQEPAPDTGSLRIKKLVDEDGLASTTEDRSLATSETWTFEVGISGATTTLLTATTSSGEVLIEDMEVGEYDIEEELLSHWEVLIPENGIATTSIISGEESLVEFINYYQEPAPDTGSLRIKKLVDEDGLASTTEDRSLADSNIWTFLVSRQGATTTLTATTSDGEVIIGDLFPGEYNIEEELLSNWEVIAPGDGLATATVSSGQESLVEFVNYYQKSSNGGNGGDDEDDPVCGNGVVESGEECDDGNTENGDGCNSVCQKEEKKKASSGGGGTPYWLLNPTPSYSPEPEEPSEIEDPILEPETPIDIPIVEGEEGRPELLLFKSHNKSFVNPGEEVVYILEVENKGNLSAFNVLLVDELAKELRYKDIIGNERTWELGDIPAGGVKEFVYTVIIPDSVKEGEYINTAEVKADNHDVIQADSEIDVRKVKVLPEAGFGAEEVVYLVMIVIFLSSFVAIIRIKVK
jgi:uncharacterized repeat protein (TIGR01451 family)